VSIRLALTGEAADLVGAFAVELTEAGATAWPSTIGGARAFCARHPSSSAWSGPPGAGGAGGAGGASRHHQWAFGTS